MDAPSRFRSLRWRLPFSYAVIALLAVLALGIALIGTLRSFYRQQEELYLLDNATAVADELALLLGEGEQSTLEPKITGYAFLIQTRIQVLDETNQEVLADSGDAGLINPAIAVGTEDNFNLLDSLGTVTEDIAIVIEEEQNTSEGTISTQRVVTRTSSMPVQGSLYGFNLGTEPGPVEEFSDLVVEVPIINPTGQLLGYVRLLQGPAYGRDILQSVVWGWAIAGVVAVVLAALTGWVISRRLTQPLLALTAVTMQMAEGDLGARANVQRADEVGLLGRSFNRMAGQVENTVKSLRQFTADAAHELHTPLTALQTDLQLLAGDDDPLRKQRVLRAQTQAQRLEDLADSLLELSLLEAGPELSAQTEFDLTRLVNKIGELYASWAEQVDLSFSMRLPDRPILISGNESQLQRAVENILDNSIKFTPAPGQISLTLDLVEGLAVLIVLDSGIGITAEDKPLLFSRFHRGRNTAGYPGSGLGLAIVQEIMLRHGGKVEIDSGDWGTKVQLMLPTAVRGQQ